jgi:2-polyprenyl-3-methyl-5-hydroxy-6-metoxy-1,4-benzoquinol methylase
MVDMKSKVKHYDDVYTRYTADARCSVSIDNLSKAQQRVRQVLKSFGISANATRALDIGCGLGNVAEALRLEGAHVTALDASAVVIRRAKQMFPEVDWRCGLFPQDFPQDETFDLIWILDVSTLNTFDVQEMKPFLDSATALLKPGGALVMGWHSDFSGTVKGNWAHWPLRTIRDLRRLVGFAGPRVPQVTFAFLSWIIILVCRMIGKSCPIFFKWTAIARSMTT